MNSQYHQLPNRDFGSGVGLGSPLRTNYYMHFLTALLKDNLVVIMYSYVSYIFKIVSTTRLYSWYNEFPWLVNFIILISE